MTNLENEQPLSKIIARRTKNKVFRKENFGKSVKVGLFGAELALAGAVLTSGYIALDQFGKSIDALDPNVGETPKEKISLYERRDEGLINGLGLGLGTVIAAGTLRVIYKSTKNEK